MRAKIKGGIDLHSVEQKIETLQQEERAALGTIQGWRDQFTARAEGPRGSALESGPKRVSDTELDRANTILRETRAMIAPFQGLVRAIAMLDSELDLGRLNLSDVDIELSVRQSLLRSLAVVGRAFLAAGPDLEKQFPMELLVELETNVQAEIDYLTDRRKDLKGPEPLPLRKPLSSWASSSTSSSSSSSWGPPPPKPIPEPVRLTLAKLPDLRSGAEQLDRLLGDGLTAKVLAAVPQDAERFRTAVFGWTLLADTALSALDYARVGARMFGHPDNRRSHDARDYDRSMVDASLPRQSESKQLLAQALLHALDAKDPTLALEAGLSESFAREVGFPAGSAQQWNAELSALVRALDDDVLIPLRSLYACSGMGGFTTYPDAVRSEMKQFVARVGRAVVEGDLDTWRSTHPASVQQLECLGSPENVERWLTSITRESDGPPGARFTTREASGNELFWATKVGGPSHAFDTMPHCILSLLGNARTKAIVLDDSRWHEHAARAYLRLFPTPDGRRMLYLEQAQIDFPYKYDPTKCDWDVRDLIDRRIVEHAIEKAKQIGASLVMTDAYVGVAGLFGAFRDSVELVLHPSGAVIEASDTLGPHDWPQGFTQTVRPRSGVYVLPAAKIAAL